MGAKGKRLPLDPLLSTELRLGAVSILLGVEEADFTYLRDELGATAGNLSVQLERLEKAGYIEIEKGYKGKRPHTVCRITPRGRTAFEAHFEALRSYL